jgi:hypothetical protein
VLNALRAAKQASDETARYLIAFVYGIIALSGAIFFTQLFHPWVLHLGIRWTHDADGDNRHAKPRSSQRPASCIPYRSRRDCDACHKGRADDRP